MTPKRIAIWLSAIASAASLAQGGTTISVDFQGRDGTNNDPEPPLAATDVAGVVAVANWNSIDNQNAFTPSNAGTTGVLNDSTGAATAVTLTFSGNDSWNNDTDMTANTSANARMMSGILKTSAQGTATFLFNNVPEGLYDVYVYTPMNGDGVAINSADWDGVTTFYTQETHQFTDTSVFAQAKNTDPAALRDQGNYIKFSGLNTAGRHAVGFHTTHVSGADGQGIAGIQLVNVGGPVVNTIPLNLTGQTGNRRVLVGDATITVSATLTGPPSFEQWYKNGTAIPGANSASYTLPAIQQSDDKASLVFVATNNVNAVTSAPIVLTVGKAVKLPGFALEERYDGNTLSTANLDDGTLTGVKPNVTRVLSAFEVPINQADNFVERISGLFVPPVSGNYTFYVCSDDDSALFLSTDSNPANKQQIANETAWSNSRQWVSSAGGSDVTSKVSGAIALVAGQSYYIEGQHHEGGGGDDFAATYALLDTEPAPVDGSAPRIAGSTLGKFVNVLDGAVLTVTAAPTNVTISAGHTATFSFSAASSITGDTFLPLPSIGYQWQAAPKGSTTFTNIPGASGANLSSPASATYTTGFLTISADGTQYRVALVANDASLTTAPVTVSIIADTTAPVVLSASGVSRVDNTAVTDGTAGFTGGSAAVEVGLVVDKPLDTTASLALANFHLNSGTVTAARYVANSSGNASLERGIVLSTTGLTPGASYTLTVSGLKDLNGNVSSAATVPVKVSKMTWSGLGVQDPAYPNDVVAVADGGFDVNSGGNGFWATDDDVTYVYETATGDFDKVVQVAYQDASSNWARAGLMVRESLDGDGTLASRYQEVNADPGPIKYDGTPSNNSFETNRRIHTGDATTSSNSSGTPKYPNVWVRLQRIGSIIHMYRSDDGLTWNQLGFTDYDPADGTGSPLPAQMYVGIVYGAENGNIGDASLKQAWAAKFRNYGDYVPAPKARGAETYAIGVHFLDTSIGSAMDPIDVAGVDAVAQGHWNNSSIENVSTVPLAVVAEKNGAKVATSATVDWSGSGNTWSSTGRGEENNALTGADHILMSGYLDTGNATTTQVHVKGLPSDLTTGKYDLLVYALGGVATRGGAYRVLAADGTTVLKDYVAYQVFANPTNYVLVPPAAPGIWSAGDYIAFVGLNSPEVIIEGTTENGFGFSGTPRAPINAIQFVSPSGLLNPVVTPTISLTGTTITFKGTLQSATTPDGPYTNVSGATSPFTIDTSAGSQKFYRTHQ